MPWHPVRQAVERVRTLSSRTVEPAEGKTLLDLMSERVLSEALDALFDLSRFLPLLGRKWKSFAKASKDKDGRVTLPLQFGEGGNLGPFTEKEGGNLGPFTEKEPFVVAVTLSAQGLNPPTFIGTTAHLYRGFLSSIAQLYFGMRCSTTIYVGCSDPRVGGGITFRHPSEEQDVVKWGECALSGRPLDRDWLGAAEYSLRDFFIFVIYSVGDYEVRSALARREMGNQFGMIQLNAGHNGCRGLKCLKPLSGDLSVLWDMVYWL